MRGITLAALLLGCDGASSDPGYGARLQVPGAQYRPGPLPAPSGGPDPVSVFTDHAAVTISQVRERIMGDLGPGTRGAVIGVAGEDDGWIVTAGPPSFELPTSPTIAATFGLADDFPPGPFALVVFGADEAGRFGQPVRIDLTANLTPPPDGELVVDLEWDSTADLDLHVIDPLGGEAYADHPNTTVPLPPGSPPADPTAYLESGILDRDGNKDCHRDGRPAEHVIWTMPPPAGRYVVRVEARAMCHDASAQWSVSAYRGGSLLGAARGVSTEYEVQHSPHGAGAGVLALQFSL
ncbi:MAG TPA: hypothetical protein VGC42_13365 [Kofleriaceae bacterium]